MSTFCGGSNSVPAMTPSQLLEVYPEGILPSDLPPLEDGLASESWVQNYVQNLEESGRLPKPIKTSEANRAPFNAPESKDPLKKYVLSDREFQDNTKKEYCFYEKRYFAALDMFLQSVADASLRGNAQALNQKLDRCKLLNQKLTVLTQVVNGISKYRYSKNSRFQEDINSLNSSLRSRQESLREQAEILKKETAAADLHKRMVEYSIEKNKSSQNLLTLYGVLNIVALGILVYISKN